MLRRSPMVLVLEYDIQVLIYLLRCVKQAGCFALCGHTGQEGLLQLQTHSKWWKLWKNDIDAIICNEQMPEMDTLEFLETKSRFFSFRNIPVLLHGQSTPEQAQWQLPVRKRWIQRFLPKQFTQNQLESLLDDVIKK